METSAVEQAMVQAGVLPCSQPSHGTNQVEPSVSQAQKDQPVIQKESMDGQECAESIQSLIQQVLRQQQVVTSVQSMQSKPDVTMAQISTVATHASQVKLPTVLTGTQISPSVSPITPQYSQIIPQSVLSTDNSSSTVAQAIVGVPQSSKEIPKRVLSLVQTGTVVSQAAQVPLNSPQFLSQPNNPGSHLSKAAEPQMSVVTLDAATLQLLQSNPGSSLVIPQRQNQNIPLSPRVAAPVISSSNASQLITSLVTSGQTSSGSNAENQSNVLPIQPSKGIVLPQQAPIPVIVEKAMTFDRTSGGQLSQLPVDTTVAVPQQSKSMCGIPQADILKDMLHKQQIVQPTILGSYLKPVPKGMSNIMGHHSGVAVSKSPTLSSHGSMVSLLTGKHQHDELSNISGKGGKSMVQTLVQGSAKHSVLPQDTDLLGQQHISKVQQIVRSPQRAGRTFQQNIPDMQQPALRIQQAAPSMKRSVIPNVQQSFSTVSESVLVQSQSMVPRAQQSGSTVSQSVQQPVVQSHTYPTHASSLAIPTTVLALSESEEESGSTQTTTTN